MIFSRRDAIRVSGAAVAGLSLSAVKPGSLTSQAAPQQAFPETLVEQPLRDWAPLPLNADGSAPEHPASAIQAAIEGGPKWRPVGGVMPPPTGPERELDYTKLKVRVDARSGLAKLRGTMLWSDLEKLPRTSGIFLLQCGTPTPKGIVKWTGVKFSDFANMIGMSRSAHYARFISVDGHYVDEAVQTLMHPQVLLAFMMNDKPIPAEFGAPFRLVIPFRYGNRSIKAVNEIVLGTPSLPAPPTAPRPG